MAVISIQTPQERRVLALKTYKDIKDRQAKKKRIQGILKGMKIDQTGRKLRKQQQGRRYY